VNFRVKRFFDLFFGTILFLFFLFPMILIAVAVRITSNGTVLYWSDRVGQHNTIFQMPKFRTMKLDTPALASHLMNSPEVYLIPIGGFLRRTSLDELPQLYSVLKGDMSFVGPRPALFNQDDLIELRTQKGIDQLIPGLTGWAQVNGRDELPISEKVSLDAHYMVKQSFCFDLKILWITFLNVVRKEGVSH